MAIESRTRWVLVACARKRNLLLFVAILSSLAAVVAASERVGASAPPDPPTVVLEEVGSDEVTVVWTGSVASELVISYGPTTGFGQAWISPPAATEHRARLTGLDCGTVYFFNVVSTANGVSTIDFVSDFRTAGCPKPTVEVSEPALQVGERAATLSWTASEPTNALLLFGPDTGYGSSVLVGEYLTSHSVVMEGLECDTTYNYSLVQSTEGGLGTTTGNRTFTTDPCASELLVAVSTDTDRAALSFTTPTESAATVLYGQDVTFGSSAVSLPATEHDVVLDGLECGTTYFYVVQTGGTSTRLSRFATDGCANRPRSVEIDTSANGAIVRWVTDAPAVGTVLYGPTESFGGAATNTLGATVDHVVELSDLSCDTRYHVVVQLDTPGQGISSSDSLALRTDPCAPEVDGWSWSADGGAGTLVVDLSGTAFLTGEVTLSGQPIRTTISAGTAASHVWQIDGLSCGLVYEVAVELFGPAGARGQASFPISSPECGLVL